MSNANGPVAPIGEAIHRSRLPHEQARRPAPTWKVVLLALLGSLTAFPAACEVRLPDGQWFEQAEDLRVKVMGGYVTVTRTWLANKWYVNSAWAGLSLKYDGLGQVSSIERTGWSYQTRGAGVWAFDSRNSIAASGGGYRWQDRLGNTIDYDGEGKIVAYADRNAVRVTFAYDLAKRITGAYDHFAHQVLWFEYAIAANQVLALQTAGAVDVSLPSAIRDASGRRVEYRYANGRLIAVVDVLGQEWYYAYDATGRLASRTDPKNQVTSITYTNGRVSSVTQPDSAVSAYGYDYDSARRQIIVQLRHPGGQEEQLRYGVDGTLRRHEIAGQLRSEVATEPRGLVRTEANGARTRDELDEWDNLVKRTHPDGSVELFEREPRFSRLSRYMDENGNETRYEYDGRGNLLRRIDAVGKPETRITEYGYDDYGNRIVARRLGDSVTPEATFTYDYDQAGNLVRAIDPEGNISAYTYDSRGNQLSSTDPLGHTWRNEYDTAGNLLAAVNALGNADRYAYDKAGNLVSHTDRRGQVWTFGYDQRNRRISRTDPIGNSAGTQYDLDGDPIRVTDEDGHARRWAYDPLKRLQSMVDGRGNVVELRYPQAPTEGDSSIAPGRIVYPGFEQAMRYDPRSRVTTLSDILGTEVRLTRYEYDKAGNRTATTNPQGNTVTYTYDALNRLVRTTDTLGHATELAYDNRDNLISVTDANAHRWRFEYDRVNRPLKESNPQGEATLLRYDAAGRLVEITDAAGQHLIYAYDGAGRLTEERHYTGAPSASAPVKRITYSYDEQGNLIAWSDGDQSATLAYDALSRLTGETVNYGAFSLGYAYSYYANGRKKSLTYPGGTVYRYRYSEHNELAAVDVGSEGSLTVNDFVWTAPAQITLPGGTVQQRRFNGLLQLTGADVVSPAQRSLLSMSAEYDSLRQLQHRSIDGIVSSYTHDSENRLIDASASDGVQESYALDAVANRLGDNTAPGTFEYDDSNRLLKAGGTTYGYDANGNLATRTQDGRVNRYFYDVTNRLTRVEDASATVVARYGYDPMGRRLWKRVGDSITFFLYAQEGLIGEYDASGQETAAYGWRPHGTWGTDPLFYKLGGRYFYAHTDHLGTPLKLTDAAGNVVWAARYTAFGRASVANGSTVDYKLRLAGQYLDQETGLHQNWLRYYDPDTGRYTTSDPLGLGGGLNQYAYAFGMPLSLTDPWGLAPESCTTSPKDQECGQLRKQIFEKYSKLIDELQKYDPVADGIGGHPHPHGVTVPGGHYQEITQLQRGIKNDITRYNRKCKDKDKDDGSGGGWGAIPRSIDEAANRPVDEPVYPPAVSPPTTTPYSTQPDPFGEPSKPKPTPTGPNIWPIILIPLLILWGLLG